MFMATATSFQSAESSYLARFALVMGNGSLLVRLFSSILFGMVFLFALSLLAYGIVTNHRQPSFFGRQIFVVTSGSMSPQINTGDLIFTKSSTADVLKNLQVGDVVTFREPNQNTFLITHRISEIVSDQSGHEMLVTKGDANQSNDLTRIPISNVVGVYESRIPNIGSLMNAKEMQFLLLFLGLTVASSHYASRIFFSLITPLTKDTQ